MKKQRLRDIVVLLPGITGSVLQKDGKDLWALSASAAWGALTTLGASIQQLRLAGDDPEVDDIGDGVSATRLMPDAHFVPGLVKIDGYSATARLITDHFSVKQGTLGDDRPANFFEFPYDWRRDNRVAARQLKRLVDVRLPQWRDASGARDAKVILIAHSMGGLVSRQYLEVLDGWRDCRALITFGTPYRGALNALDFVANGYKRMFLDLSEMMRSFTSVYQLLPIYAAVKTTEGSRRVAEIDGIPNVDRRRASDALAFHRGIETAVTGHRAQSEYLEHGYRLVPVVGTRQPTLQSAVLAGGALTVGRDVPEGVDEMLAEGDGTVPRVSATPIELSYAYLETFVAERHGSLQNNRFVLDDLLGRLQQMQVVGLSQVRGPQASSSHETRPALSLDINDVYHSGEPIALRARLVNVPETDAVVEARIAPVGDTDAPSQRHALRRDGDQWTLEVAAPAPGLYRVEVSASSASVGAIPAVHDLFAVAS